MTARSGWAYGEHIGSQAWLTILGSAHTAPVFYPTREEAERALDESGLRDRPHLNMTVAHVTEAPHGGVSGRGYAYRVTPARREWVTPELRKYAVPDEYGRVSPFAVYAYWPETQRETVQRNLLLDQAEAAADKIAADRPDVRVHVSLDTCG